jgi:hypothetical protein
VDHDAIEAATTGATAMAGARPPSTAANVTSLDSTSRARRPRVRRAIQFLSRASRSAGNGRTFRRARRSASKAAAICADQSRTHASQPANSTRAVHAGGAGTVKRAAGVSTNEKTVAGRIGVPCEVWPSAQACGIAGRASTMTIATHHNR